MPEDASPRHHPIAPEPAADPDSRSRAWISVPARESISARNLARQNAICLLQKLSVLFWLPRPCCSASSLFSTGRSRKAEAQSTILRSRKFPNQNAVLVAVNVTVHNSGEKPLWIHDIKATLKTDGGEFTDVAASAVDYDRYFQAFPTLKEHALAAIPPETKIPIGGQAQGTVVVSFPVTQDGFDKRKSLSVVIQPYDQPLPGADKVIREEREIQLLPQPLRQTGCLSHLTSWKT